MKGQIKHRWLNFAHGRLVDRHQRCWFHPSLQIMFAHQDRLVATITFHLNFTIPSVCGRFASLGMAVRSAEP